MHGANDSKPDPLRDRLLALAAETRPPRPLPGAGELLWKAEIRRRLAAQQEDEQRIVRPAVWGLAGGLIVGVLTVLVFTGLQLGERLGAANLSLLDDLALFGAGPAAVLLVAGLWRLAAHARAAEDSAV